MNEPPKNKASEKITVTMEFTENGYLKSILMNAQNSDDEAVLERALDRLLRPGHLSWIKRLLRQK